MTIMLEKSAAAAGGAPGSAEGAPGSPDSLRDSPGDAAGSVDTGAGSVDGAAGSAEGAGEGPQGTARLRFWLGVAFLAGGLAVGAIGFFLSFDNLTSAASAKFGFDPGASAILFALGVDATIVVCLVGDLMFATRGRAFWLLRPVAGVFTCLTIYLNATAHSELIKAVPHAAMPVVFVVLVEAARHYLVMEAALEMGIGRDPIPWHRWIFHPFQTAGIVRTMTTWTMTYTEVRTQRRKLAVYEVWLKHREEIERGLKDGKVGVLDRLPVLLAPHGVGVEEARALPAVMREREEQRAEDQARADRDRTERKEQQRLEDERRKEVQAREDKLRKEAQDREDKHRARLAELAAEEEETRREGQVAVLRARSAGATRAAQAEADGAGAAAEMQARTALAAVERAATEAKRLAALEEAAEETQRIAEARSATADAQAATAESERKAAEERALLTTARVAEERAKADAEAEEKRAEQERAEKARHRRTAAEDAETAAEKEVRAAELAELAAEKRARAAHTEALADLSPVQIRTRVVARLLLATPDADGAAIAAALGGASPAKASSYKGEALKLIERGYPDVDPDLTPTPWFADTAPAAAYPAGPDTRMTISGQTETV